MALTSQLTGLLVTGLSKTLSTGRSGQLCTPQHGLFHHTLPKEIHAQYCLGMVDGPDLPADRIAGDRAG